MLIWGTMSLFWFHAFREGTIRDLVHALAVQVTVPPPEARKRTLANETILGIEPSVYAYLGRTLETFGGAAVALLMESNQGAVSPFDTGGLVANIMPVCGWKPEKKRLYLRAHTWPSDKLAELLTLYPGANVASYLREDRPSWTGPHVPLRCVEPVADIWSAQPEGDWRCWTWELRCTRKLISAEHLVHWSCSVPLFQKFIDYLDNQAHPREHALLSELASKYVEGGVTRLVCKLRETQGLP